MTAVLLSGTFGVLLAAGGLWAAAPLLAETPSVPDGRGAPDAVGAEPHGQAGEGTGTVGFSLCFNIYP